MHAVLCALVANGGTNCEAGAAAGIYAGVRSAFGMIPHGIEIMRGGSTSDDLCKASVTVALLSLPIVFSCELRRSDRILRCVLLLLRLTDSGSPDEDRYDSTITTGVQLCETTAFVELLVLIGQYLFSI